MAINKGSSLFPPDFNFDKGVSSSFAQLQSTTASPRDATNSASAPDMKSVAIGVSEIPLLGFQNKVSKIFQLLE